MVYRPHGAGRYVIVASNGGSRTHPAWYRNLKANPVVDIEVGAEAFTVRVEEVSGTERDSLWAELLAASPSLREYEAKAARQIPVLILTRDD